MVTFINKLKSHAGLPQQFFLVIQEYSTKFHGKTGQSGQKLLKYSKTLRNTWLKIQKMSPLSEK